METKDYIAAQKAHEDAIATPKLYRVEVIADDSGKWHSNTLTFPTLEEAKEYGFVLFQRWVLVKEWRVVRVNDEQVVYNYA